MRALTLDARQNLFGLVVPAAMLEPAWRLFESARKQGKEERQGTHTKMRRHPQSVAGTATRATYAVAGMPIRPNIRMRA
jgi:hypothetical protein